MPQLRSRCVLGGENWASGGTMSVRASRLPVAGLMSASLLVGLAVAGSSGATTPDTVNERFLCAGDGRRDDRRHDAGHGRGDEPSGDVGVCGG